MNSVPTSWLFLRYFVVLVCAVGQTTTDGVSVEIVDESQDNLASLDIDPEHGGVGSVRLAHGVHEYAEHLDYLQEALEAAGTTSE